VATCGRVGTVGEVRADRTEDGGAVDAGADCVGVIRFGVSAGAVPAGALPGLPPGAGFGEA